MKKTTSLSFITIFSLNGRLEKYRIIFFPFDNQPRFVFLNIRVLGIYIILKTYRNHKNYRDNRNKHYILTRDISRSHIPPYSSCFQLIKFHSPTVVGMLILHVYSNEIKCIIQFKMLSFCII